MKAIRTLLLICLLVSAVTGQTPATLPQFSLPKLDGQILRSEELKDNIVVLDFWATWCENCVGEIPAFNRMQEKYSSRGVTSNRDSLVPGRNALGSRRSSYSFYSSTHATYANLVRRLSLKLCNSRYGYNLTEFVFQIFEGRVSFGTIYFLIVRNINKQT